MSILPKVTVQDIIKLGQMEAGEEPTGTWAQDALEPDEEDKELLEESMYDLDHEERAMQKIKPYSLLPLEFDRSKSYIVFVDETAVDAKCLIKATECPVEDDDFPLMFVFVHTNGRPVSECIVQKEAELLDAERARADAAVERALMLLQIKNEWMDKCLKERERWAAIADGYMLAADKECEHNCGKAIGMRIRSSE